MSQQRRRFKQAQSLQERCAEEAKRLREEAKKLPPGPPREEMLRKARQAETASHMSEWLLSPELKPPAMSDHNYRVYVMGRDGRVAGRIDLHCESEADAREQAKQLVDGHAVELWDGARRVERLEPKM